MSDIGADDLGDWGEDQIYEELATEVAARISDEGGTTANGVDLDLETDDPEFVIDYDRVRRQANDILGG
ncbi:hypothetical protein [Herbiconiux sp.]|uniref:hypothetical protein n=1 Tax=Herbiconiux sp. TaxID=1871186 RepID=UPI0025BB2949|nr:hypothetical protein [Herbiconiux sp.]